MYFLIFTFFHETSLWLLLNKDLMNKKYYIHIVPVYTYYIVFNSEKKIKTALRSFLFILALMYMYIWLHVPYM